MSGATRKSNNNPSLFFKHQRSVMLHKLCAFVGQQYVNTYMTLKRSAGFLHCYYIHCCVYFKKDHARKREFHEYWIYNPTQTPVLCIKLIFHSLNTNMHCKEFIPQQCTSGYEESCTHYQSKTVSYIILLKDKDQYATAN